MSKLTAFVLGLIVFAAIVLFVLARKGYLYAKGEDKRKSLPSIRSYMKEFGEWRKGHMAEAEKATA